MKLRNVPRWCALAALLSALAGTAPASAGSAPDDRLPVCPPGDASTKAPTGPAGPRSPGACRATGRILESGVQPPRPAGAGVTPSRPARVGVTPSGPAGAGVTPSGYHHLGANTSGVWSGVSGRISVVDGSVRPGTYDFVAGRFMVKRALGRGNIAWLEAGWAETGWASPGRQHIYTFDTNTKKWQFYDQYALKPGGKAWLDLHSDSNGVWGAWLWWNNRWNLLTAQRLPIGATGYVEQYLEVHVDPGRPGRIDLPPVTVDNVRLRPAGGGAARPWRDDVPTLTGVDPSRQQRNGGFCLNWVTRYDTWTVSDCDAAPVAAPGVTVGISGGPASAGVTGVVGAATGSTG